MPEPLPGPKPVPLNLVAVLYRWGLGRYARKMVNPPLVVEHLLGATRRGAPLPRRAVFEVFAMRFMEIIAVSLAPGALLLSGERPLRTSMPTLAGTLGLMGTVGIFFPFVLLAVVGTWRLLPERRPGGYLLHPSRLWPPTIAVMVTILLISLLTYDTFFPSS